MWDTEVSSELKVDDCTPDGAEDEAGLLPEALHHLKQGKFSVVLCGFFSSQMLHVFVFSG